MDLAILRKKISSYKTSSGRLTKVSDELTLEILHAWEQWTGPASGFYAEINVSAKKMARVIGRGKELKRDGFFIENFNEVEIAGNEEKYDPPTNSCQIELVWKNNLIRFGNAELLLDFLNRADKKEAA